MKSDCIPNLMRAAKWVLISCFIQFPKALPIVNTKLDTSISVMKLKFLAGMPMSMMDCVIIGNKALIKVMTNISMITFSTLFL